MKLLVTRPEPDGAKTAELIGTLGHEVHFHPLLTPEYLQLTGEHNPAAIAVTSRNGVRALAFWPESLAWRSLPVFAVGDETGKSARAAGFTNVISADGDGKALAALIRERFDPSTGPLLYAAGRNRSQGFTDALKVTGVDLDLVVAYHMPATSKMSEELVALLRGGSLDGVVFYSRRSAELFILLTDAAGLADIWSKLDVFALSERVASVFRGRPVRRIEVADAPREDALLELLRKDAANNMPT